MYGTVQILSISTRVCLRRPIFLLDSLVSCSDKSFLCRMDEMQRMAMRQVVVELRLWFWAFERWKGRNDLTLKKGRDNGRV